MTVVSITDNLNLPARIHHEVMLEHLHVRRSRMEAKARALEEELDPAMAMDLAASGGETIEATNLHIRCKCLTHELKNRRVKAGMLLFTHCTQYFPHGHLHDQCELRSWMIIEARDLKDVLTL